MGLLKLLYARVEFDINYQCEFPLTQFVYALLEATKMNRVPLSPRKVLAGIDQDESAGPSVLKRFSAAAKFV